MQRRNRLGLKLTLAFIIGLAIAILWMYGILHVSVDPDVPISMTMKILMFLTAPPFLLSFALGGLYLAVPVLNGLVYMAVTYLWHLTRRASRHRRPQEA